MPTVALKATLRTGTTPLPNKTITFYYRPSGGSYTQLGNPKTTDSNGIAISDQQSLASGTYDFRAVFAGDDNYDGSQAEVTGYVLQKLSTMITLEVIRT